ncbi:helix-turn-helix domain-containing protein [Halomonas caseinilytica]|uniref:helix-turn-helix domain-containing protein n=1 Tax=Halomonas caseinilytica TaxID=438744 RepID=UPI00084881BF|nr:helix-turn-helix transcriptional regulator [Halomonas caseinilytica]
MDSRQTFAKNIRRLRQEAGLSQEELANRAGLHRTYISSIECGQRNVSLDNIFALARALDVPASLLLEEKQGDI